MNRTLTRVLLSLAVATMGVIDLLSALLSRPPERIVAVRHLLPTDVIDPSRTFTLLAGALLLVTAWGLRRGKRRAFVAALFLCAVSVPFNLLKAFDFEEATVAAGLMFVLGASGEAFQVKSRELSWSALRSGALFALLGVIAYAVVGCWIVASRFALESSFSIALHEAGYRLLGIGDSVLRLRPELQKFEHRIVIWYLDSVSLIAFTLLSGLALAALRPVTHRGRHRHEVERVAQLVHEYGDNSVSAFALAPETDYFFSSNRRAVIAYRFQSDTLLVVGDPIGPEEEIQPLLREFAAHCRERDWQFAFFQARPERLPDYRKLGWRAIHIGEDPLLWTDRFTLEGSSVGELRRMVRKLERQGLEARMFVPGENPFDPARESALLEQLREISNDWMRARHGGEKGFCMGRFDPHTLHDSWLAVAWNPARSRAEAFATWVPIPARQGWAVDMMRRRSDAPTGATEFLVVKSVDFARLRGDRVMSLSLAGLARVPDSPAAPTAEDDSGAAAADGGATGDDRARAFLMETLARYYDFKGLFRWKKKFNPVFEDRYLVYPEALALPRVARALIRAQTP
ncbi:MAG: bifunctional lysylphosphatidylglycerol flippase/synthetase MprF, partial [Candidatus Eiseniibacteriota bacterium]